MDSLGLPEYTNLGLQEHIEAFIGESATSNMQSLDSAYYEIPELKLTKAKGKRGYFTLHLNIHSLPDKHSQLIDMLADLKEIGIVVDFILLCETFLTYANAA